MSMKSRVFAQLLTLLLLFRSHLSLVRAQPAFTDRVLYRNDFEEVPPNLQALTVLPDPSTGFTWTQRSGSTPSIGTGPNADHTTLISSGHYMYTEASDIPLGDQAGAQLPPLVFTPPPAQPALCLTFWRHMYGENIGTLNVTQTYTGQDKQTYTQTLWTLSGDQTNVWIQTNVTLGPLGSDGSFGDVTFVGVCGGTFGDMAIDDVILYDGACGADTTTAATTTTTSSTTTPTTTNESTTSTVAATTKQTTTTIPTTTANVAPITTATTEATTTPGTTTTSTSLTTLTAFSSSQKSLSSTAATSTALTWTSGIPAQTSAARGPSLYTRNTSVAAHTTSNAPAVSSAVVTSAAMTSPVTSMAVDSTNAVPEADYPVVDNTLAATTSSTEKRPITVTENVSVQSSIKNSQTPDGLNVNSVGAGQQTTAVRGAANSRTTGPAALAAVDAPASPWGLPPAALLALLACLASLVFILTLIVIGLACCLRLTRQRYHVTAPAANQSASSTSALGGVEEGKGPREAF